MSSKVYQIFYVPGEEMGGAYGLAYVLLGKILIQKDLPRPVELFVLEHELYHMRDKWRWGGWMGMEIRANFAGAISHPLGFLISMVFTLTRKERVLFYLRRFRKGQ